MTVIVGSFVSISFTTQRERERVLKLPVMGLYRYNNTGWVIHTRWAVCVCVCKYVWTCGKGVFLSTLFPQSVSTYLHNYPLPPPFTPSLRATRASEAREIRKQNPEWWGNNGGLEGSFAFLWIHFPLIVIFVKGNTRCWLEAPVQIRPRPKRRRSWRNLQTAARFDRKSHQLFVTDIRYISNIPVLNIPTTAVFDEFSNPICQKCNILLE